MIIIPSARSDATSGETSRGLLDELNEAARLGWLLCLQKRFAKKRRFNSKTQEKVANRFGAMR